MQTGNRRVNGNDVINCVKERVLKFSNELSVIVENVSRNMIELIRISVYIKICS